MQLQYPRTIFLKQQRILRYLGKNESALIVMTHRQVKQLCNNKILAVLVAQGIGCAVSTDTLGHREVCGLSATGPHP